MSDFAGIALIITAIATLLTAAATAASIIMQELNRRQTDVKLAALHDQGNSNLEKMRELARKAGLAEGNLKGREEQKAEHAAEEKER